MKRCLSLLICLILIFSLFIPIDTLAVQNDDVQNITEVEPTEEEIPSTTDETEPAEEEPEPEPIDDERDIAVTEIEEIDNDMPYAEDRVIVKLKESDREARKRFPRDDQKLDLGVKHKKARLINPSKESNVKTGDKKAAKQNNMFVLTLETPGKQAVQDAIARLNANPRVEYAEPDYYLKLDATPSDPQYSQQWGLNKIQVPEAWNIATGSNDVVVGVLDTGIDGTHPDLVPNLWHNPGETMDGIDTDDNGYVDDAYGYDFVNYKGGIPYDKDGHGTHVAGIVGAVGDNGVGVSGVNWNVKVAWLGIGMGGNLVSQSAAIEAISYAQNMDIMILNASFGWNGAEYLPLQEAIENYKGLFVAAAGNYSSNNDATPYYPAGYDCANVISVAAADPNDQLASFSNYEVNSVDIAAPGVDILSTYPDNRYINMGGTSMASPMVAGVAALAKAVHPEYTALQIKEAILNGADILPSLFADISNGRRLNALYALSLRPEVETIEIINMAPVTLDINESAQFTAVISPQNAQQAVLWNSSNPEVASVSATGTVTALSKGSVTITASSYAKSAKTATIEVNVTENISRAIVFKDLNFKATVVESLKSLPGYEQYNTESNLYPEDLEKITSLSANSRKISCVDELSYFTHLVTAYLDDNQLTELDISSNSALTTLYCNNNQLSELYVGSNPALATLYLENNQLSELDLSNNPELKWFNCNNNQLSELDLSDNSALILLYCNSNQLSKLYLSDNPDLAYLYCSNNQLSELDISSNPMLAYLYFSYNRLSELDVSNNPYLRILNSNNNQLSELDVSNNLYLTALYCENNQLSSLNVNSNPYLTAIYCYNNQLSELITNGGSTPALITLSCGRNQLSKLNVSGTSALTTLSCSGNQLSKLDISNSPMLETFDCSYNQLTSLDVSGNAVLTTLSCDSNQLKELDINSNSALITLSCYSNQLSELAINSPVLETLYCQNNKLVALNISSSPALSMLYCQNNQLTELNVSNNPYLIRLYCSDNPLSELDARNIQGLRYFECRNSKLISVNFSIAGKQCSVISNGNGYIGLSVQRSDSNTINSNVYATPAEGNTFINWILSGNTVSNSSTYSFDSAADYNLVANFTVPVTGITVDQTTAALDVGATQQLTATVLPENATDKSVTWSSDKPSIATVDEDGLVSAVALGTATITATTVNGKTAMREVAVSPKTETIGFNNVIIFIAFNDITPEQETAFKNKFNTFKSELAKQSANIEEMSYGQATIVQNYASSISELEFYKAPQSRSYWQSQGNNSVLLINAVNAMGSKASADNLDADNDGCVDNITFIVQGNAIEWGSSSRAYMSRFSSKASSIHGKYADSYNFIGEPAFIANASTLTHEMLHSFGVPDLYRSRNNGQPIGKWDFMASSNAGHITTYVKMKYCKWITEIPELTESGSYTLLPQGTNKTNNAYMIKIPGSEQYFVIEYRYATPETLESRIDKSGLIIYRICPFRRGNTNGPPDELYVLRGKNTPEYPYTALATGEVAGRTEDFELYRYLSDEGDSTDANTKIDLFQIKVTAMDENSLSFTIDFDTGAITGITLDKPSAMLEVGGTQQLTATVWPSTALEKTVTWSSDNISVATVDENGLITAVALGDATITAKTINGLEATCKVTVFKDITNDFVDPNFLSIVRELLGKDSDDHIYDSDVRGITQLVVPSESIRSLAGVKHFKSLQKLYCYDNELTELDVSTNTDLEILWCNNNQLSELDVSKNIALAFFNCSDNPLASLSFVRSDDQYSILANGNGYINFSNTNFLDFNTQQYVTAIPGTGSTLVDWRLDGNEVSTAGSINFNITTDGIKVGETMGVELAANFGEISKEATPSAAINYTNETLTGFISGGSYMINGSAVTLTGTTCAIQTAWLGTTVLIVKKGDGTTAVDSVAQSLAISARSEAPTAPTGDIEKITGVTTDMEYKLSTASMWTAITGTEITELSAGTYEVRTKATTLAFASAAKSVTVRAQTRILTVRAPTFDLVTFGYTQPAAKVITISNSGNSTATVSSVTVSPDTALYITGSGNNVPAGGSITTWSIQPKANLGAGMHTATITVMYDDGAKSEADISFTVNAVTPAIPQSFIATPSNGQVKLNWSAPSSNGGSEITKYQVTRDNWAAAIDVNSGTTYTFTGLTNGTSYTFKIRAVNAAGNGAEATAMATPFAPPNPIINVTGVSLDTISATLTVGTTQQLNATVTPADATNKAATWSTNNAAVAAVDQNGLVTAVGRGTAVITITTQDGGFSASCTTAVKFPTAGSYIPSKIPTTGYKNTAFEVQTAGQNQTITSGNSKVIVVEGNTLNFASSGKAKITIKYQLTNAKTGKVTTTTITKTITVKAKVESITLSQTSATIARKGKVTLVATISPADATNKAVVWTVAPKGIATVSSKGVVTGVKGGTCTVTAKSKENGAVYKTVQITVTPIYVTSIKMNKSTASALKGKTFQLKATVAPSNTDFKTVNWSSSDTNIATVDSKGKVKAISPGTCTITATSQNDSSKYAICTFTTLPQKVTSVKIVNTPTTVAVGQELALTATVGPANADNKTVEWTSSNESIAIIDKITGKVTFIAAGKVTIKATATDGSKKVASKTFTVK